MFTSITNGFRSLFTTNPVVDRFHDLIADSRLMKELTAISSGLRADVGAELGDIARILGDMVSGDAALERWLALHPLDDLIAQATDLHIVYTPGKVGSRTVAATLQPHPSIKSRVRNAHFLSEQGLAFAEDIADRCVHRPCASDGWRDMLLRGRWLRILIAINRAMRRQMRDVKKPTVITGVREPIALHLSFCFESSWMYADTPNHLTADFVRARLADDAWHRHCNRWLSNDLGNTFGIDVYSRRFPCERGWCIDENCDARVLLIRQESLDNLPSALGALYNLDASTFHVTSVNTAAAKPYAVQYESVKDMLRLRTADLNEIYSLPYVQHFYSRDEIRSFKDRWSAARVTCLTS